MSNEDKYPGLNLIKGIASSITIIFCFILIIAYFISFLQVKFNIFTQKDLSEEISEEQRPSHSSFMEKTGLETKEENTKKAKKIGLGSHYMFYLILSHFFGGIIELIYILLNKNYKKKDEDEEEDIECQLFGFLHNFFDLSSICWTTMLTYLFYKSTNLSSEILYKDEKYLLIGFLYWFLSCFIFVVVPFFEKEYGFSNTYCAFRKKKKNKKEIELLFWIISFIVIVFINSILNCFWLFKTTIYYSKKLQSLKRYNIKEYKFVFIYVKVFKIFPIVLLSSRIVKLISVVFALSLENKTISKIFIYLNGISFNINGALNSLACIYFFRGVFWCCFSSKNDNNIEISSESNICNDLYEPVDSSNDNRENLNE